MVKQVPKTDKVKSLLAKIVGDENLNFDDFAVYEAVFANTQPLRRTSGLYNKAILGADMFAEAIARLDAGETIPLAVMHRGNALPEGRVMSAWLAPGPDNTTEMRGLFYLNKTTSAPLIAKLDSAVINEVSVNMTPKSILCSACGFDYLGSEATFDHVWSLTCANGHEIGKEGVRVHAHGLASWNELSLVDRGAVSGAKIMPRGEQSNALLAAATLYAAEVDLPRNPVPKDPKPMTVDPSLVEQAAKLMIAERDLATANTTLAAAQTEITSLKAKITELEAQVVVLKDLDGAKMKVDLDACVGFIDETLKAALAALGRGAEALPATVGDRVTLLKDLRAKLATALPTGGVGAPAATPTTQTPAPNFGAFKTR